MVAKFTFDFLKFDDIFLHVLKIAYQLDFRLRRYLDLKTCFISAFSRDNKFTVV